MVSMKERFSFKINRGKVAMFYVSRTAHKFKLVYKLFL